MDLRIDALSVRGWMALCVPTAREFDAGAGHAEHGSRPKNTHSIVFLMAWLLFFGIGLEATTAHAQERPLHARIDQHASGSADWLVAAPTDDALSLRRLSLDLRNVVPSSEELDAFAADGTEGRWQRWVDKFLTDPLHRERLVDWYDKTLMQRRPFQHVDRPTWLAHLRYVVDTKVPLDQWLRDTLQSHWWNRSQRAQQRFYLDRGGDPHAIARDLGRVLFGRDMQCAQCHDHPQIDDYLQIDYHGLLAFVSAGTMVEGKTTDDKGAEQKLQMYVEKAPGDAPFESVFNKGVPFRSATRLPGAAEKMETYLPPDGRYNPQPMPEAFAGLPNPPSSSRRGLLASQLNGANRPFAENWANRIWALMLGRGLVHPLDMHHFDNPASNPALLAELTDALVASQFDVSSILREIALSQTYRRGRITPLHSHVGPNAVVSTSDPQIQTWLSSVPTWIEEQKTLEEQSERNRSAREASLELAFNAWREIQKERVALRAELDAAESSFNESHKKWNDAVNAANLAASTLANLTQKIAHLDEASVALEKAKALGDDADIQSTLAATRAKSEALRPQLVPLEQSLANANQARDGAHQAQELERSKWQSIVDRLLPVEQRLADADRATVEARAAHQTARRESAWHQTRIVQLERLQHWLQLSQQWHSTNAQPAQLAQQRRPLNESLVAVMANTTSAEQSLAMVAIRSSEREAQRRRLDEASALNQSQQEQLARAKTALLETSGLLKEPTATNVAIQAIDESMTERSTRQLAIEAEIAANVAQQTQMDADMLSAQSMLQSAKSAFEEHSREIAKIDGLLAESQTLLNKLQEECGLLRAEVEQDLESQLCIATERALSPEQFGWSLLMVTGQFPYFVQVERNELEKQSPLPPEATPETRFLRELQATRGAVDKLQGNIDGFSNLYASGVGQTSDDFFASPDQALFVSNGGSVVAWSAPNGSNVTSKVVQATDPLQASRTLIWSLLAREPSPTEQQWMATELSANAERKPAVAQELVWGVLAGVEFRLYP